MVNISSLFLFQYLLASFCILLLFDILGLVRYFGALSSIVGLCRVRFSWALLNSLLFLFSLLELCPVRYCLGFV